MGEKHDFWYWVKFTLLCIWQLPQFLVATAMLPFLGKKTIVANRHYNICWRTAKMRGGISLGPFSYVSPSLQPTHISHEVDGHTVDSKRFGPLYLFIIGIPSILNAAFRFTDNYYDFYTEKLANKHARLRIVGSKLMNIE